VYRRWDRRGALPALDIVVNLRPRAATADFRETRRSLERQLDKLCRDGVNGA
jgi:RNase P protein component